MLDTLGTFLMRMTFFCILTPISFVMRLFGYDPLKLQSNQAMSQWSARNVTKFDRKFFNKQG